MARRGKERAGQMSLPSLGVRYDPRFMEAHAGARILHDPKTAIVELIANSWDAGATEVEILWPDGKDTEGVSVEDNGVGMTNEEFDRRWRTLSYNRPQEQGMTVVFPEDLADGRPERRAFGRNGIGRWSGFCFGDTYFVETWKDGRLNRYKVSLGSDRPFVIERLKSDIKRDGHGTWIECSDGGHTALTPEEARSEIGMRFLTDPDFEVSVNGNPVDFSDIEDPNIKKLALPAGNGNTVELIVIDTQATDRTTKQHGIAWHVGGRLVGTCSWKGLGPDDLIDGRRVAAKRFTFIVRADFLADTDAIKRDWSGFDKDNEPYQRAASAVYEKVREYLLKVSEEDRKETLAKARARNRDALNKMGPLEREKWTKFVQRAQETCPSIKENDIVKLSEVVANLEQAKSGYALLHKLSELDPDQLDDLHKILEDWTLDMAKLVLDEIGRRLELIEELRSRILDKKTQEVQELQPLFERGLWIFGPEFETIEYTSNEGMTRIVQDLFKRREMTGSRNRPDFAILPDGTAGLYSYPRYDEDGEENGTDRLVIVELKRPGVKLGDDQKAQCWKYVKELYGRGLLRTGFSKVRCFLLGSHVDELEDSPRVEMDGSVEIRPMLFNTVLKRAESRLLKLHERVKNAPFLREHREELDAFLAQFEESDVAESLFIG